MMSAGRGRRPVQPERAPRSALATVGELHRRLGVDLRPPLRARGHRSAALVQPHLDHRIAALRPVLELVAADRHELGPLLAVLAADALADLPVEPPLAPERRRAGDAHARDAAAQLDGAPRDHEAPADRVEARAVAGVE